MTSQHIGNDTQYTHTTRSQYLDVSAVNHVTGKKELLDRTLKMPLVQGHPVVFGQNICYMRKEYYLF